NGGFLNLASGGIADVLNGGLVKLESGAVVDVLSGGQITVESGGEVRWKSGSVLQADSGSNVMLAGTNTVSGTSTMSGTWAQSGVRTRTTAGGYDVTRITSFSGSASVNAWDYDVIILTGGSSATLTLNTPTGVPNGVRTRISARGTGA